MFVVFTIGQIGKEHKCLLQMNRQRKWKKLHLIECYKTLNMGTILSFKTIQKNPEGLMLGKTGQRQSNKWCMILHMAPQKAEHREREMRNCLWGRKRWGKWTEFDERHKLSKTKEILKSECEAW